MPKLPTMRVMGSHAISTTSVSCCSSLACLLAVVVMSGALFGYDQGVISGALDGIKKDFTLGALLVEVVTSWVTLGALVGALLGGDLADRFGRKKTVLVAGALDWESYAVAGPGSEADAPLPLGALLPPEDVRLLQLLWAERPELAVRWLAEIDQEEPVHRAHALLEVMARDPNVPTAEGHGGGE